MMNIHLIGRRKKVKQTNNNQDLGEDLVKGIELLIDQIDAIEKRLEVLELDFYSSDREKDDDQ